MSKTETPSRLRSDGVLIRSENFGDAEQIRAVNQRAFGRQDEAALVDNLRASPENISLVAVLEDRIVGHILFTRVRIEGAAVAAMGLAPMALLAEYQRRGIGSALVRAGLDACRSLGNEVVVVVGHPDYYPRFGFVRADTKGLRYEDEVPPEAFMVVELRPGALAGANGIAKYRDEFKSI